jgi:hypothetical protein
VNERSAYLAAEGFVDELAHELATVDRRHGRLLIASGPPRPAAWAANVWLDPQEIRITSISDAAAKLRAIQRNWALYAPELYRRATLIQGRLPKISAKPLVFGAPVPASPLGSWTLLDAETILAAPHCTNPFPSGEIRFIEDRSGPPSRAYLKLWEALTLLGRRPEPGEICLDLGSSPGGWSWALPRVLPGAAPDARRALARRRHLPPFRLHDQVPGRDRPSDRSPFRRHPGLAAAPSVSQQARVDLDQNRLAWCIEFRHSGRTRWSWG